MVDVLRSYILACQAHAGQLYGDDQPYIRHPYRVARNFSDPVGQAAALLHDTVEDTPITLEEIRAEFGPQVAEAVDAMTRREGEKYLEEYIPRVARHPIGRLIKIADLRDHLYHMEHFYPRYRSLRPRYTRALEILQAAG